MAPAEVLLQELLTSSLVLAEDWDRLPLNVQKELKHHSEIQDLLPDLVTCGLLTQYQAARIHARKTFGLILGNYRVLDRLGAGGMGVVFKAEHLYMRRQV